MVTESGKLKPQKFIQLTDVELSVDGKKMLCLGSACNGEVQIFDNTQPFSQDFESGSPNFMCACGAMLVAGVWGHAPPENIEKLKPLDVISAILTAVNVFQFTY